MQQVPIHLFICCFKNPNSATGELLHLCYAVISSCSTHYTASIYAFQKSLISCIKETVQNVKKKNIYIYIYILFWWDSISLQKYENLQKSLFTQKLFWDEAEWYFFATLHGKGPCNGVGCSNKCLAALTSLQKLWDKY
jgi:hypothetical protein